MSSKEMGSKEMSSKELRSKPSPFRGSWRGLLKTQTQKLKTQKLNLTSQPHNLIIIKQVI